MFAPKVKIPRDLLDRVEAYAKAAGYASVDEFVAHVLAKELDRADAAGEGDEPAAEKRLRGLGYIE